MKVFFCSHDGKNIINGINTWLLTLLPALKNAGIEVEVIFITWASEQECTSIPILKKLNIECHIIDGKRYTENEVQWIIKHIKNKQPDIFVANNMIQAAYAAKWIQQAGIPTIAVLHNDDSEYAAIIEEFATGKNGFTLSAIVAVSEVLKTKLLPYKDNIVLKKIPYGVPLSTNKSDYQQNQQFKI